MARVTVGNCRSCGRELKVKEGAVRPLMKLTCTCGQVTEVGEDSADSLVAVLEGSDLEARLAAALKLSKANDSRLTARSTDALIAMLRDNKVALRLAAAAQLSRLRNPQALERMRDPEVGRSLVSLFLNEVASTAGRPGEILQALLNSGSAPSVVEALCVALNTANAGFAAFALGEIRDPRAVAPLLSELESSNSYEVKEAISKALGKIGGDAVEPLVALLLRSRADPSARQWAASALIAIGDVRAIQPLVWVTNKGEMHKGFLHQGLTTLVKRVGLVSIPIETVRAMGQLADRTHTYQTRDAHDFAEDVSRTLDYSEMRDLARRELRRRGLEA